MSACVRRRRRICISFSLWLSLSHSQQDRWQLNDLQPPPPLPIPLHKQLISARIARTHTYRRTYVPSLCEKKSEENVATERQQIERRQRFYYCVEMDT